MSFGVASGPTDEDVAETAIEAVSEQAPSFDEGFAFPDGAAAGKVLTCLGNAGNAAWQYPINLLRQGVQGRMYCYTDTRWISLFDDQYGGNYYQIAESAGAGSNPVFEWEHGGIMVSQGDKIRRFTMQLRTNNTQVTDIQFMVVFRTPAQVGRLTGVGVDNDAEMSNTQLFFERFFTPADANKWGGSFTGNMADTHRRSVQLNFTCPQDGWIGVYAKPIGNLSGTRYAYLNSSIDLEV